MKFKLVLIFFLISSCTYNSTKLENRSPYNSKGFAIIYNDNDFNNKTIKGKLDNSKLQVSHRELSSNTLIKIINPKTKDSINIRNLKKINYPDFYKILISKAVANKLNINQDFPLVEIFEIKKNKSFIAKKAKIFNEEKKISSKAPVTSVQISNISKNKSINKSKKEDYFILLGNFYSAETIDFLNQRIAKDIPGYDMKKLKTKKSTDTGIDLISGPYKTINLMKNDYILLKKFGFEELDIITDD